MNCESAGANLRSQKSIDFGDWSYTWTLKESKECPPGLCLKASGHCFTYFWGPGTCRLIPYSFLRVPNFVGCGILSPKPKVRYQKKGYGVSLRVLALLRELYSYSTPTSPQTQEADNNRHPAILKQIEYGVYMRNMLGVFQPSCSIYSKMAVDIDPCRAPMQQTRKSACRVPTKVPGTW